MPADLNLTGRPLLGSQYQVALGLASWEIDFWGRVRSLQDAALENYLATDAARRAATIGLIAQVANSYLALARTRRAHRPGAPERRQPRGNACVSSRAAWKSARPRA